MFHYPLFPTLKPKLVDSLWFNVNQPCDDEVEVEQLEQDHQIWLNSIAQRNSDLIPIGKTATETLDEDEEDDEEDDNDDDDESETHDEEDDEEIEMDVPYDPNSSVANSVRSVPGQGQ
ncbi:hypothetical protein RN001_006958 [Aquatica leii]|uniref:Anaphase-promoting complex subunit 15 n=1 Tax=Aquatica leii TaxID=1421715 RepID=A0AAN7Q2D6_9COLE|nr:hypothetical protein RN001_006958 [Aquatica leii]